MATYSSILSWKIPWMEESGRLQSVVSPRVGHGGAASPHSFTDSDARCWFLSSDKQPQKCEIRDFCGGPVAKNPSPQNRESGFHPWSGN